MKAGFEASLDRNATAFAQRLYCFALRENHKRKIEQVITRVTQPPPGKTRWSVRSVAKQVGISRHSVNQLWKKNALKPHLARTFKISKDPAFEKKFWDVIALYQNKNP